MVQMYHNMWYTCFRFSTSWNPVMFVKPLTFVKVFALNVTVRPQIKKNLCSQRWHLSMCVLQQVDKCEGWLLAQRSVGRSMQSKLNPAGTASSMESAPTYTRYRQQRDSRGASCQTDVTLLSYEKHPWSHFWLFLRRKMSNVHRNWWLISHRRF